LPCYLAGLRSPSLRRMAAWCSLRLPAYFGVAACFNGAMMFLLVTWLPDWEPVDYIKAGIKALTWTIGHVLAAMDSLVFIIAFLFVVFFKDRIAMVLGLDHTRIFRFKLRDFLNCFQTTRFRPIELILYKVEDLPAADILTANNVFVEVWGLGYNEGIKTRVHNNAGSSCILKETMHLNFDEGDEEDNMNIFIKHAGMMMGSHELGRAELTAANVVNFMEESDKKLSAKKPLTWEDNNFLTLPLHPRGVLHFRIVPVDDGESYTSGGFYRDLTTC